MVRVLSALVLASASSSVFFLHAREERSCELPHVSHTALRPLLICREEWDGHRYPGS